MFVQYIHFYKIYDLHLHKLVSASSPIRNSTSSISWSKSYFQPNGVVYPSTLPFKVKYKYNDEAFRILEKYYGKSSFNDGRKKMAKMPKGSKLIYNPSSAAPGFITKNVLSLPGVPSILNSMIDNCTMYLTKGLKVHSKTLNLYTVESNISKKLGQIQKKYKKFVDIGSYPFFRLGKIGVAIVMRSTSLSKLKIVKEDLLILANSKKIKILKI